MGAFDIDVKTEKRCCGSTFCLNVRNLRQPECTAPHQLIKCWALFAFDLLGVEQWQPGHKHSHITVDSMLMYVSENILDKRETMP